MAGWKQWQIGEVVEAADFQSYVQDQVVQVYASSAARGSALGTAVTEGMVAYLADTNSTEVYDGSSWIAVGAGDITAVTAGTGLSGGGTSGSVTLNVNQAALYTNGTAGQVVYSLGTAGLGFSTVGTAGQLLSSTGSAIAWVENPSPNYSINGGFDIFQRGSSGSLTLTGSGYAFDRWYAGLGGNVTFTQQSSGSPIGSNGHARIAYNASSSFSNLYQALESAEVNMLQGKTVVLSAKFRRNASFAADLNFELQKNATANTLVGGTWSAIANTTITNANLPTGSTSADWLTVSISTTVPDDNTANGLRIVIAETATGSSGHYYEVAQVQLEVGSVATPFRRAANTLQGEFAACARYFERIELGRVNTATSGSSTVMSLPYMTRKRSTPSVSTNATNANYGSVWTFSQSGVSTSSKSGTVTINFDGSNGGINHLQINAVGATYSPTPNTLESLSALYFDISSEL